MWRLRNVAAARGYFTDAASRSLGRLMNSAERTKRQSRLLTCDHRVEGPTARVGKEAEANA